VIERELEVPGARLRYEVRGSGPLLAVIGAPMAAAFFAPLAEELAADRTELTNDPRGIAGSALDGPAEEDTPELRADDVWRVIEAAGGGPVDVFGSSGGGVTGLALVTTHPELVRTLVAHEPPVARLLPDAAERRASTEHIVATFHEHGVDAAMGEFLTSIGVDPTAGPRPSGPLTGEVLERMRGDNAYFLEHQIRGTSGYEPDVAALRAASTRIVIGVGAGSTGQVAHRAGRALAEQLGTPAVEFPGDHGGFIGFPREFAAVLSRVLDG
jgi:pimeloyl-ACP methyl ester carboxylesterase